MMENKQQADLKGCTVVIRPGVKHPQFDLGGAEVLIEDRWDRLTGGSWMTATGNPACLIYAMRTGFSSYVVPTDDDVWYGKLGGLGVLVHRCEIVPDQPCEEAPDE
jgi:hypothetical protein